MPGTVCRQQDGRLRRAGQRQARPGTYQSDPRIADNVHTEERRSFAGWHHLVFTVSGGRVRYFVDGALIADHAHVRDVTRYVQQADYMYIATKEVATTAEVTSRGGRSPRRRSRPYRLGRDRRYPHAVRGR
jgi:hypothetical protein